MTVRDSYPTAIPSNVVAWANWEQSVGENWPELLQVLFVASQSLDAGQREGAFRIFTTTPGIIEKQHESTVLAVFTKGFKDDDVSVRHSDRGLESLLTAP